MVTALHDKSITYIHTQKVAAANIYAVKKTFIAYYIRCVDHDRDAILIFLADVGRSRGTSM